MSKSEDILAAARRSAQAHGYGGLNFRDLAEEVGIKAASIYHHFPSKADLGAAVARRYWQDTAADLETLSQECADPKAALAAYPRIFRRSLECENRLCLVSFMSAEYDDLPDPVKAEVQAFADVNVGWLAEQLQAAGIVKSEGSAQAKAKAIFASIAGAQLMARSRCDLALFDAVIEAYRDAGLIPDAHPAKARKR
jgi:TetR/AcrR family transcriptional repressor of nem operon